MELKGHQSRTNLLVLSLVSGGKRNDFSIMYVENNIEEIGDRRWYSLFGI